MYILENWAVYNDLDPYKAPECQSSYLGGNVYNHPKFDNGYTITTSRILDVDPDTRIATSYSGSKYKLGKISDDYEKNFPNAEKRFFNSARLLNEKNSERT